MNSDQLFRLALGIENPWESTKTEFKEVDKTEESLIYIDFKRGSQFTDATKKLCGVHDTVEKTWRHLT